MGPREAAAWRRGGARAWGWKPKEAACEEGVSGLSRAKVARAVLVQETRLGIPGRRQSSRCCRGDAGSGGGRGRCILCCGSGERRGEWARGAGSWIASVPGRQMRGGAAVGFHGGKEA